MTFYSKRYYEQFKETVETIDTVAARIAARKAGELAIAEREAAFPVLTAENAQAAVTFQTERQAFYARTLAGRVDVRTEAAKLLRRR